MARFTTNLTVTTAKETTSASISGDYTEVFSLSQVLDNDAALHTILSNSSSVASLSLNDCKTLMIKNSGIVGAEVAITLNEWTSDAPDADVGALSYVTFMLSSGEFIMLPNIRMLQFNGSVSAADSFQLNNQAPDSNMYVAVNNPAASDAQLTNEALDDSETDIVVDDSDYFYAGDLIRIENEIMEVTAVNNTTNALTVIRGSHGSTAGDYSDDKPIRFPFFNAYSDFDKYTTVQTDSSGRFKCMNFIGFGRATDYAAAGIVPGSASGKFYNAGYQELGMSGVTSSTESGLTASETLKLDITVDGGTLFQDLTFTLSSNTKFGGSDGVIRKIQDALDVQYYTAGNLFNKRVTVAIVNGDIRFTSGQRLSTSAILLADTTDPDTFIDAAANGRIPASGDIEAAVAARLPQDTIADKKTGISSPNVGVLFYDDGRGNISGACSGTINYETGAIDLNGCPPNAHFVLSANYGSAHSGGNKFISANANSIMQIQARSTNAKVNTTIDLIGIK